MEKVFNFPMKTFDEGNLVDEVIDSKDNTLFLIGEKITPCNEGDDIVELVWAKIFRTKSN